MSHAKSRLLTAFFACALIVQSGCLKKEEAPAAAAEGGGGAGGTFTASDLNATWSMSTCTAGTSGLTGATHYKGSLTIFGGGNFNYAQIWYPSSACSPGAQTAMYSTGGTYSVGGLISGSSSLQSIDFTATSSTLAVYTAGLVTDVNAVCAGGGWVLNTARSTFTTICTFMPTPDSANDNIYNVASLNGSSLSFGAMETGVPGNFTTAATSSSITYTK